MSTSHGQLLYFSRKLIRKGEEMGKEGEYFWASFGQPMPCSESSPSFHLDGSMNSSDAPLGVEYYCTMRDGKSNLETL